MWEREVKKDVANDKKGQIRLLPFFLPRFHKKRNNSCVSFNESLTAIRPRRQKDLDTIIEIVHIG